MILLANSVMGNEVGGKSCEILVVAIGEMKL